MRVTLLGTVLLLAAGCDLAPVSYDHASTLYTDARGVAMVDGETAQVGMSSTTCEVTVNDAMMGTDYDYPGSDDEVHTTGKDENGDVVVVVESDKGLHIQRADDWFFAESTDVDITGVQDVTQVPDGTIALVQRYSKCEVVNVLESDKRVELPMDVCFGDQEITGDPSTGDVYVGHGGGIVSVPAGVVTSENVTDEAADLVAWDSTADCLYAAESGSSVVRAYEADGTERWRLNIEGGVITALTDTGDQGVATVSVSYGSTAALVGIDGFTGLIVHEQATFEAADELTASADGKSIAATRPGYVDFFNTKKSSNITFDDSNWESDWDTDWEDDWDWDY